MPRRSPSPEANLLAPVSDIVTEPGRHLGCVRDAADPCKGGHVVQRATLGALEADVFAETSGNERRTCSMGWPKPRSMASENAASTSASRRPESRSLASSAD